MLDIDRLFVQVQDFVLFYGLKFIIALFILMIGLYLVNRITTWAYDLMTRKDVDPSLRPFLRNVLKVVLLVLLIMVVIGQVGLQITSFLALLGSAGLAVGLALQGSLANFAGGVLLLTIKPFRVGDFIEAQGQKGTVFIINIFNTVITTEDNKTIYLPNGPLASAVIVNYDVEQTRRLELSLTVEATVPLAKVREEILKVVATDERVLLSPEPSVGVEKLSAQAVTLFVRVWVQRERGTFRSGAYEDLTEKIKDAFEKAGIALK
ncbi:MULTISPECIES: mechanosensitive ion channel family protein [Rufibacter]|uniref:Small conductance mechanosensitive channel n=1 Tax=Rufibacter quisquiliarum TaxID=1549639 RepID=A0A839GA44_9BACT|nr:MULTISPECIES: mechanosensitive ion channel domain-containing protein [Rufibacter]MBA9075802.1 small conductance mechanosensitive channel [Rufibacter quisquiliarum]